MLAELKPFYLRETSPSFSDAASNGKIIPTERKQKAKCAAVKEEEEEDEEEEDLIMISHY